MLPRAILVTFEGYIGPTFPNKDNIQKLVPIVPVTHSWKQNRKRMARTMLPVILGYALTIHKGNNSQEETYSHTYIFKIEKGRKLQMLQNVITMSLL